MKGTAVHMGLKSSKRKRTAQPEEINFDFSAREDYLTGFHKRKLQRAKYARDQAAKQDREERIAQRKLLRNKREVDYDEHVKAVNALTKQFNADAQGDESTEKSGSEDWQGFDEPVKVDHEDQYIDEDRYTTVTIEAVNVTRNGLEKTELDDEDSGSGSELEERADVSLVNGRKEAKAQLDSSGTAKRAWSKENTTTKKRKRKKFRYETKAERKITRSKERSGNRTKAKARRERG